MLDGGQAFFSADAVHVLVIRLIRAMIVGGRCFVPAQRTSLRKPDTL